MLLSLSYCLLQALLSLVLHAKTLAVTLDSTCYHYSRRCILRILTDSPGMNQAYFWEALNCWHHWDQAQHICLVYSPNAPEEQEKTPATIPVSNKRKETNTVQQASVYPQQPVDRNYLEQGWGVLLHQWVAEEATQIQWNWQWRRKQRWRTHSWSTDQTNANQPHTKE